MKIFISNLNESWIVDRMKEEFSNYYPDIVTHDIKKCDIILYKGSSVCIEAVMNGLIPLNFHEDKNCFSYDPLYKVNNFKVRNSKMIKLFVNSLDKKEKRAKIKKNTGKIQKYCELYFQKLNQSSLINNLVDEKN